MDITTISCGEETRQELQNYRDENGFKNYNQALKNLLTEVASDESNTR